MYKRFFTLFAYYFSFGVIIATLFDFLLPRIEIDRRWIVILFALCLFNAYYWFVVIDRIDIGKVRWAKIAGLCIGNALITYGLVLAFGFIKNLQTWALIVIPAGLAAYGFICIVLIVWFVKAAKKHDLAEINERLKSQSKEDDMK
ncbi:MAG: hypothetical protein IJK33_04780 [Clostridia bacterium]|nr:hypothetical protein [Clostridia bacterium]